MKTMNQEPEPLRVAAYARVSSINQVGKHDDSIDTQIERIRSRVEYENKQAALSNEGKRQWQLVGEYREEGRSGKNVDRPEFQRLLSDMAKGKFDTVAVVRLDRITRNVVDFHNLWREFERFGVEFLSLGDSFDTHTAQGRAMLSISLVFAQMEREVAAERTRDKIRHRQEHGMWTGGFPPPGYMPHPTNKTLLAIDPDFAPVVKRHIFQKFLEAQSARAVVRHLAEHDIRRPKRVSKRGKQIGGTRFDTQAILNMLANTVYIAKRKLEDESMVDCLWEPIIADDLFQKVQAKLAANRFKRPTGRNSRHLFLLEGLVRCGKCGAALTSSHANGRAKRAYHYYKCSGKHRSVGTKCSIRDVPADLLEDFVIAFCENKSLDSDMLREAVRVANLERDSAVSKFRLERQEAKNSLQTVESRIRNLLDQVETGQATSVLMKRLQELQDQKLVLEGKVSEASLKLVAAEEQCVSAEETARTYRRLSELLSKAKENGARQELKALLQTLIDVVEWHEDPKDPEKGFVVIQLFAQVEEILSEKKKPDGNHLGSGSSGCVSWLPRTDSNCRLGG